MNERRNNESLSISDLEDMRDEPLSETEREILDTVECGGMCGRHVFQNATVDVVVGKVIGGAGRPESRIVTSADGQGSPEVEQWCAKCADEEFDINKVAGERSIEESNRILTPSNLAIFLTGFFTALIIAFMTVV